MTPCQTGANMLFLATIGVDHDERVRFIKESIAAGRGEKHNFIPPYNLGKRYSTKPLKSLEIILAADWGTWLPKLGNTYVQRHHHVVGSLSYTTTMVLHSSGFKSVYMTVKSTSWKKIKFLYATTGYFNYACDKNGPRYNYASPMYTENDICTTWIDGLPR